MLQPGHRADVAAGARPRASRRRPGRLHAVHGAQRRAGAGSRRRAVPHAVHDLPRRTARRDVRAGHRDRERAPRASSGCRRSSGSATCTTLRWRSSRCRGSSSPTSPDAANVLRIGPVLDAPPLCREVDTVDIHDGSIPLVLVSLSTSEQGQADLLQRCVDAVAQLPVRAIVTTGPSSIPRRSSPAPTPRSCATCRTPSPAVGLARDHPRRSRHHAGGARVRRADGLHADGPRPVLQRRAGRGARRRPDADAGLPAP